MECQLFYGYNKWVRELSGIIVVEYSIFGAEEYIFPTIEEMNAKADELFSSSRQVPQKIVVEDWRIVFTFSTKLFSTKKDRLARDSFFQWIIDNSKTIE